MITALISSVFLSSLLGSGHCVSMCGPFLFIANGRTSKSESTGLGQSTAFARTTLYNLGRLLVYLVFGIIAGSFGMLMQASGSLFGLQQAAILFAGTFMIAVGLIAIARNFGWKIPLLNFEPRLMKLIKPAMKRTNAMRPGFRAFVIGTLTSLMPCGWLYVYVIAASSTQSLILAPVVMAIFWLGTLPILTVFGWTSGTAIGVMRQKAIWIMPISMVFVGVLSILFRSPIDVTDFTRPKNAAGISAVVKDVNHTELPCCSDDDF